MDAAKVSVCLPTWNGERYVAEAIRSILSQTYEDFKLIVVDDCSDDSTPEIVRAFTDPRITVYPNERRLGIPGNWNRCLDLAKGEFLCIFHQDDLMLPENLERKVAVLSSDPSIGMVHSAAEPRVEVAFPEFSSAWMENSSFEFVAEGPAYLRKLLLRGNCICAPTVVARRECLSRLGGFNERFHFACDYELWMKLCVDSRLAYISTPLVVYRWHDQNATHEFRFERGFAETQAAARSALGFYREKTGRIDEAALLAQALNTVWEIRRWLVSVEADREHRLETSQRKVEELGAQVEELEAQLASSQQGVEQRDSYLKDLESRLLFQILAKLGLLPDRSRRGSSSESPDSS